MKYLTLTLFAFIIGWTNPYLAQTSAPHEKPLIWMSMGGGLAQSSKIHRIYDGNLGVHVVLKGNHYLSASGQLGLNPGGIFRPNEVLIATHKMLSYGMVAEINDHFKIIPSFGLLQSSHAVTVNYDQSNINSTISFTNNKGEDKLIYLTENITSYGIPVQFNLLYTTKRFGIGLNYFLLVNKVPDMGVNLTLNFGRLSY